MDISPTSVGRWIATAVATGWLVTGSITPNTPDVRESRATTRADDGAAPVVSFKYSDELRERLNHRVTPERGRNPFSYGSRHVSAPSARRDEPVESVLARAPLPADPPAPVIKLSGIATNQQDGTTVMTAIVIDNGKMVFAKAGDTLPSGLLVVRVDEGSIILADAVGVTQTLRLP